MYTRPRVLSLETLTSRKGAHLAAKSKTRSGKRICGHVYMRICTLNLFRFLMLCTESLLQNRSSFLHGREPAGNVPIYALVKNCLPKTSLLPVDNGLELDETRPGLAGNLLIDEFPVNPIETNNVPGKTR